MALACARGEPQELGFTNDALASSEADTAVTPRSFFGAWVGVAQDALALADDPMEYRFPSGSTQIHLNIIDHGIAHVVFGAGEPPADPIDPNVSYPPGLTLSQYEPDPAPLEGFEYPLYDYDFMSEVAPDRITPGGIETGPDMPLDSSDGILRFQFSMRDALAPWCAEQRTREDGHGGYNCLGAQGVSQAMDGLCYTFDSNDDFYPRGSFEASGVIPDPARQVDCVRSFQCFDQCECPSPGADPEGTPCFVKSGGDNRAELWLRKTAEGLLGAFAGDAVFENARGARTSLGRVRFVPADD